eukprot:TRINITY_DN776_c0_g2_i1.p1 TRINITY_DN776_c0_g2~~TRINITY_DN776_c0_g2_i1.p1  ORF type:complete len:154 (+),score=33.13 TRINITY_DN776_c0_g2_i1:64-462(+)
MTSEQAMDVVDNEQFSDAFLFNKLPYELKVYVFSFFDYPELCLNGQVNKEWYSLSTENSLWKMLYCCHFPYTITINGGVIGDSRTRDITTLSDDKFYKDEFTKEQKIWKTSKDETTRGRKELLGLTDFCSKD